MQHSQKTQSLLSSCAIIGGSSSSSSSRPDASGIDSQCFQCSQFTQLLRILCRDEAHSEMPEHWKRSRLRQGAATEAELGDSWGNAAEGLQ